MKNRGELPVEPFTEPSDNPQTGILVLPKFPISAWGSSRKTIEVEDDKQAGKDVVG